MSKTIEVRHPRKAWAVMTNSDLTEGRGYQFPLAVCEKRATAERLGKKGGVQGADCDLVEVEVFIFDQKYYGPVRLVASTKEDDARQGQIDKRQEAIAAAKAAGLTEDQIMDLSSR